MRLVQPTIRQLMFFVFPAIALLSLACVKYEQNLGAIKAWTEFGGGFEDTGPFGLRSLRVTFTESLTPEESTTFCESLQRLSLNSYCKGIRLEDGLASESRFTENIDSYGVVQALKCSNFGRVELRHFDLSIEQVQQLISNKGLRQLKIVRGKLPKGSHEKIFDLARKKKVEVIIE